MYGGVQNIDTVHPRVLNIGVCGLHRSILRTSRAIPYRKVEFNSVVAGDNVRQPKGTVCCHNSRRILREHLGHHPGE
jgi:hypothetical protein